MGYIRVVRAVGGLLAIVTLLGLVVLDFLNPALALSQGRIQLLVVLIGALLGVDIALGKVPVDLSLRYKGNRDGTARDRAAEEGERK